MRQDAKTLLDRLDRHYLEYRDFTAAAEEIELWPLFQALLRDPRIIGNREQDAAFSTEGENQRTAPGPKVRSISERAEASPAPSLFDRYLRAAKPDSKQVERPQEPDLRNFLHQLGRGHK
ncbi:hypothetical protein [Sphingomonas sp. 3-13AW]|jgi:hypothetical protein|uniref:hypothetical protein n=1 Tax=Sphingomonas sp. 3-13AW TaxID=3050450 RepID=UPI003BB70D43